jgi:hypothetical protein
MAQLTSTDIYGSLLVQNIATFSSTISLNTIATTGAGFTITGNSITSGDGLLLQSSATLTGSLLDVVLTGAVTTGDAAKFQANSYVGSTTSGLVDILSTSTARADGSFLLYLASSGANASTARNVKGAKIIVTNTNGTSGTNTALELTASGATTSNVALSVTAGDTNIQALTAVSITETSSMRFKENIRPLDRDTFQKLLQLKPVLFDRKDKTVKDEIGLIAEEVLEVIPELITLDEKGEAYGIKYQKLAVLLLQGYKYLFEEIQKLKD